MRKLVKNVLMHQKHILILLYFSFAFLDETEEIKEHSKPKEIG